MGVNRPPKWEEWCSSSKLWNTKILSGRSKREGRIYQWDTLKSSHFLSKHGNLKATCVSSPIIQCRKVGHSLSQGLLHKETQKRARGPHPIKFQEQRSWQLYKCPNAKCKSSDAWSRKWSPWEAPRWPSPGQGQADGGVCSFNCI